MIKDVLTASELLETFFQSLTDLVRSIIALIIPHQSISASKTRMDRNETHEVIASLGSSGFDGILDPILLVTRRGIGGAVIVRSGSRRGVISRRVGRAVIPCIGRTILIAGSGSRTISLVIIARTIRVVRFLARTIVILVVRRGSIRLLRAIRVVIVVVGGSTVG